MFFGEKILVWGYGEIGKEVVDVLKKNGKNIVAIVDKMQDTIETEKKLYPIEEGLKKEFDQVIIAIGASDCKTEITQRLEEDGMLSILCMSQTIMDYLNVVDINT